MNNKGIYIIAVIISMYLYGCSAGEYELTEVNVEYEEKLLVYDTLNTALDNRESFTKNDFTTKSDKFTFIVQIGAFIDESNFNRFFASARSSLGEVVYYQLINNLYKIRLGGYNNIAEALKMVEYVKKLGYYDAFVITVKHKQ